MNIDITNINEYKKLLYDITNSSWIYSAESNIFIHGVDKGDIDVMSILNKHNINYRTHTGWCIVDYDEIKVFKRDKKINDLLK